MMELAVIFDLEAWVRGLTLLCLSCENLVKLTLLFDTQETLLVWTCYNSMIQWFKSLPCVNLYFIDLTYCLRLSSQEVDPETKIPMQVILFFLTFKNFNWRLITLQYCAGFCHTLTWISHECTCIPHPDPPSHLPPHLIPQGHPSEPALSTLSHASNLDWWSISHLIIYMFQCSSLTSSHSSLLPQSPQVCSLHLCLFCCLTYRVIITIFLNSTYMCVLVFFFLTYFTLYNGLQFHPPH